MPPSEPFRWCWTARYSRANRWTYPPTAASERSSCRSNRLTVSTRARFESNRHDSLHEDDRFSFAIERADPHPVLFLHAAGEQRDELYYRAALESVSEAGFVLEPLAVEQAGNQALSKYAFVVLSDIGRAASRSGEQPATLTSHAGGSLLVVLGVSLGRPSEAFPSRTKPYRDPATPRATATASRSSPAPTPSIPSLAPHQQARRRAVLPGHQVDPGQSRVIARLTNQTPAVARKASRAKAACWYSPPPSTRSPTISRCTPPSCRSSRRPRATWAASRNNPPTSRSIPTSSSVRPRTTALR